MAMQAKHRRIALIALVLFILAGALVYLQSFGQAEAQTATRTVDVRAAKLKRGVNIQNWFRSKDYLSNEHFDTYMPDATLRSIKAAGFDHVRLPIEPRFIYNATNPSVLKTRILPYLDKAITRMNNIGLAVVVDFHVTLDYDIADKMENTAGYAGKIVAFWRSFAKYMSKYNPEMVMFETMNEPMFMNPRKWYEQQNQILAAMRESAPKHTLIANANNLISDGSYAEPESLVQMTPLADQNIIYNFHFYESMTFTHQGADWMAEHANVYNLPYPSSPEACVSLLPTIPAGDDRTRAKAYCDARWNLAKIDAKMKKAADWAAQRNLRLLVNEFGVYEEKANSTARTAWFRDVRSSLNKYGIGWTVWAYDDDFGPTSYDWDNSKWVFNQPVLKALIP